MKTMIAYAAGVAVLSFSLLVATPHQAYAGMWEKLSSLADTTVPSATFTIEAKGWNVRAYEFVSPTGAHCIFVAGEQKGGLSCDFTDSKPNP